MIMRLAGNPTGCPLQRSESKGAVGSRCGSYRVASLGLPSSITLPFTYGVLLCSCCDCRKMKEADLTEGNLRENQQAIATTENKLEKDAILFPFFFSIVSPTFPHFFHFGGNVPMASNTMPFIPSLGIFTSRCFAQEPHQSIISGDFLPFCYFFTLAASQESLENHASKYFSAIFTPCHSFPVFAVLLFPFFGAKVLQLSFFDSDARSDYFLFKVASFSYGIFSQNFLFRKPDFCKLLNLLIYTLYAIKGLFLSPQIAVSLSYVK